MNKFLAAKRDQLAEKNSPNYSDYRDTFKEGFDAGVSASKEYYDEMIRESVAVAELSEENMWFENEPLIACNTCDMGDSGYSKLGPGHHDDKCIIFRLHMALSKYEKWKAKNET